MKVSTRAKILLCCLLMAAVPCVMVAAWFLAHPAASEVIVDAFEDPAEVAFGESRTMNILVLGIDYNYNRQGIRHTKGARSDTIMVARVDRWGNSLSLLSIPRDSRVLISPNYGMAKINEAFSSGGVAQAKRTVAEFLGIPIHHYVLVKTDAAADLVNVLGGVPLTVEKSMHYDDSWAHFHVHLEPGPQRLSGEQAVGYCRFRNDEEGDIGRIRRQQQFIAALVRELKQPKHLVKANKLAELVALNFESDLSASEMLALGRLYQEFSISRIRKGTVEGYPIWIGGVSFLDPYLDRKNQLVDELFVQLADPTLGDISTEVYNGAHTAGAAAEAARKLQQAGFYVDRVQPGGAEVLMRTRVTLRSDHPGAEAQLKRCFGKNIEIRREQKTHSTQRLLTVEVGLDGRY